MIRLAFRADLEMLRDRLYPAARPTPEGER